MTADFIFVAPTADSNPEIRSEKGSVHQLASSMLPKFERYSSPVATEWSRKLAALTAFLILVAVILLLTSLCYLKIQTRSAWILSSSFHVRTATSMRRR